MEGLKSKLEQSKVALAKDAVSLGELKPAEVGLSMCSLPAIHRVLSAGDDTIRELRLLIILQDLLPVGLGLPEIIQARQSRPSCIKSYAIVLSL